MKDFIAIELGDGVKANCIDLHEVDIIYAGMHEVNDTDGVDNNAKARMHILHINLKSSQS